MKKIIQCLIVTISFILFSSPCFSGENTISLVTLNWGPYADENLENYGFTSEIISKAFERAGYRVSIAFKPWKRALIETEDGKYDAVYCAYYTDERAKIYGLSEPYAESILGFFKRKDRDIRFATLPDLKPYKIGVTLGYANSDEFDKADYFKKETSPADEVSIKKLEAGRIDLATMDKYVGFHILNTTFKQGKEVIEFMEKPLVVNNLYVCFSRAVNGWEKKRADFNSGLVQIKKDGTYDKILKKHGF